ncbi:excisionase family DNA-binding protein [Actinomadura sp. NEAU-AAG7]|uniref:excisionase family DNA-binding protein n=1 Tax=Actinomadura sp. NEAU-AAG7 TaxID=2839640 RepID=UPI001BE4BE59|nr:excisionase family DNA-binding protein [Actinomadura sp. NEAU-AAG7]MBT2207026.1 excisionase family DNA-binding protein [Actinomadura sp. NEAU-AAG7]
MIHPPVTVPPGLERPLLRVLVRALAREVRVDGGIVPPGIAPFLADLAAVADQPDEPYQPGAGSAAGTPPEPPAMVEISVRTAAEDMGASPEYVRRLCRDGRLRARRVGRTWLIDPTSLTREEPCRTPAP